MRVIHARLPCLALPCRAVRTSTASRCARILSSRGPPRNVGSVTCTAYASGSCVVETHENPTSREHYKDNYKNPREPVRSRAHLARDSGTRHTLAIQHVRARCACGGVWWIRPARTRHPHLRRDFTHLSVPALPVDIHDTCTSALELNRSAPGCAAPFRGRPPTPPGVLRFEHTIRCPPGMRVRPSDETPTGLELHATRTDNTVSKESGRDDEKSGIRALQTRG